MNALVRRFARYAAVSAISTVVSLTMLGALVATRTVGAGVANIIATAVGTVPSFELNRRWVWGKRGRRSLRAEVGPFWAMSFAGLGLSTVAVTMVSRWADRMVLGTVPRTLAVEGANVAAFGSLWVLQYLLLDRALFGGRAESLLPEAATDGVKAFERAA